MSILQIQRPINLALKLLLTLSFLVLAIGFNLSVLVFADSFVGTTGNDTLDGTAGSDTFEGLGGRDTFNGGDGNDTYIVEDASTHQGTVIINDTAGNDTLDLSWAIAPSVYNSSGNDLHFYATSPQGGIRRIDIYSYSEGDNQGTGLVETIKFKDITHNFSTVMAKKIGYHYGTTGDESFEGSSGRDNFYPRGGNDTIEGYDGNDLLFYDGLTDDLTFNINPGSGGASGTITNGSWNTTFDGINAIIPQYGDNLSTFGDNTYNISTSIQVQPRGNGTDIFNLNPGASLDLALQHLPANTYDIDLPAGTIATDTGYSATINYNGGNISILRLDSSNTSETSLLATDQNDVIAYFGGTGNLDAGDGVDTLRAYRNAVKTIDLEAGTAVEGANTTNISNFERAYGGINNDTLLGDAKDNYLAASLGQDILNGRGGNDTLRGGGGDDIYIFEPNFGQDFIQDDQGADTGDSFNLDAILATYSSQIQKTNDDYLIDITAWSMVDSNRDLLIDFGDGNTITINDYFDGSGNFTGHQYGEGKIENIFLDGVTNCGLLSGEDSCVSLNVNSGGLYVDSPETSNFNGVTIGKDPESVVASIAGITVEDLRGSLVGWNLNLSINNLSLVDGDNNPIPEVDKNILMGDTVDTTEDGNYEGTQFVTITTTGLTTVSGRDHTNSLNLQANPTFDTLSSLDNTGQTGNMLILNAPSQEGAGKYTFDISFAVDIPAYGNYNIQGENKTVIGGTYQGELVFDLV